MLEHVQPIRPPAQVPVTNRKAPLISQFVARYSLTRTQASVSAQEINPITVRRSRVLTTCIDACITAMAHHVATLMILIYRLLR